MTPAELSELTPDEIEWELHRATVAEQQAETPDERRQALARCHELVEELTRRRRGS